MNKYTMSWHFNTNKCQYTGYFITYISLLLDWIPFCLQWFLNSLFHQITKGGLLDWWMWGRLDVSEFITMYPKPVVKVLSFVTWCIITQEYSVRLWTQNSNSCYSFSWCGTFSHCTVSNDPTNWKTWLPLSHQWSSCTKNRWRKQH